jgi:alpha/beta superfamily hydrolase
VIADYLTRQGFIVLRVDDRGIGKSTGDFGSATSADFANDASSSIDYLITRPEVNKKKIGLIGHSEGA